MSSENSDTIVAIAPGVPAEGRPPAMAYIEFAPPQIKEISLLRSTDPTDGNFAALGAGLGYGAPASLFGPTYEHGDIYKMIMTTGVASQNKVHSPSEPFAYGHFAKLKDIQNWTGDPLPGLNPDARYHHVPLSNVLFGQALRKRLHEGLVRSLLFVNCYAGGVHGTPLCSALREACQYGPPEDSRTLWNSWTTQVPGRGWSQRAWLISLDEWSRIPDWTERPLFMVAHDLFYLSKNEPHKAFFDAIGESDNRIPVRMFFDSALMVGGVLPYRAMREVLKFAEPCYGTVLLVDTILAPLWCLVAPFIEPRPSPQDWFQQFFDIKLVDLVEAIIKCPYIDLKGINYEHMVNGGIALPISEFVWIVMEKSGQSPPDCPVSPGVISPFITEFQDDEQTVTLFAKILALCNIPSAALAVYDGVCTSLDRLDPDNERFYFEHSPRAIAAYLAFSRLFLQIDRSVNTVRDE